MQWFPLFWLQWSPNLTTASASHFENTLFCGKTTPVPYFFTNPFAFFFWCSFSLVGGVDAKGGNPVSTASTCWERVVLFFLKTMTMTMTITKTNKKTIQDMTIKEGFAVRGVGLKIKIDPKNIFQSICKFHFGFSRCLKSSFMAVS